MGRIIGRWRTSSGVPSRSTFLNAMEKAVKGTVQFVTPLNYERFLMGERGAYGRVSLVTNLIKGL